MRRPTTSLRLFFALLAMFSLVGCARSDGSTAGDGLSQEEYQRMGTDLFASALDLLKQTQDFDPRNELRLVTDRFNQWLATIEPPLDWHPDPLVEKLPDDLRALPSLADLKTMKFTIADGPRLREVVWLRDIFQSVAGRESDPLERASLLFDWTIRNIQLDTPSEENTPPTLPWETLAMGHGQAVDRAWIFALLGRQAGLDIVLLATDDPNNVRLAALWQDGELYLFDAALGLPIPGPDGIATFAQATTDAEILGQLAIEDFSYPITADKLREATVLIEGSSLYLEQSARAVEEHLAGGDRMVLSVDATALADELRPKLSSNPIQLWTLPYVRERQRAELKRPAYLMLGELVPTDPVQGQLWKGRALHLMGRLAGERSATSYYLACRLPDEKIASTQIDPKQVIDPMLADAEAEVARRMLTRIKEDASYWLGLVAYDRGKYDTAVDYFTERTMVAYPEGIWDQGARYNLARCYEALGERDNAITTLRQTTGPQRHGNLLRARGLENAAKSE